MGAFGFSWLGKLYFSLCLFLSWGLSRYFRVFAEDSSMLPFIGIIVKIIGLLFLSSGSSNREVTVLMIIVGWNAEYIHDWSSYLTILSQAKSTNNYVANRKKVSILYSKSKTHFHLISICCR